MSLRILTLVHSHISKSFGGSEHAAFALDQTYQKENEAWILTPGPAIAKPKSNRDIQIESSSHPITMCCTNADQRNQQLAPLLEQLQPQIIHLHHYLNFGIDIIQMLKELCPKAKIVLTLHEYLLLCAHNGQMLKRETHRICRNPSPEACANCFPELDPNLFTNRKTIGQAAIDACDGLISPSHWLLEVMGQNFKLPAATRVIENGLPPSILNNYKQERAESSSKTARLNRFGFFGRASENKGLLLLLQACYQLNLRHPGSFELHIHGGGLDREPAAIQHRIQSLIMACGDLIQLHGRYQQDDIPELMEQIDWVVVPSIWWENSPVVIQEAFACRRPVIGSNHGGIAEKIIGQGGIEFQPNSAEELASCMAEATGNAILHQNLQKQMPPPFSIDACAEHHLSFYNELME